MIDGLDPETRARLLGVFVAEATEELVTMHARAVELAEKDAPTARAELMRLAHGLKGAGRAVGIAVLPEAFHRLEEEVAALAAASGDARPAAHRALLATIGLLQSALAEMAASGRELPSPATLHALQAAVPAESSAAPKDEAARGAVVERVHVPTAALDETLRLAASVARAAAALPEQLGAAALAAGGAASTLSELTEAADRLSELLGALRLLPVGEAFAGLDGEARELAGSLGKELAVEVAAADARADGRTLGSARALLRHLVRNALDHGIEEPQVREWSGKPRAARLAITAAVAEGRLRVEVEDDGRGFDVAAIRRRLAEREGPAVATLTDAEALERFAHAGGSTRAVATEVSGRGVGLSAVAHAARTAGGELRIRSKAGSGSTVAFSLPLQAYSADVLLVRAAGRTFGVPIASVERTVHLDAVAGKLHDGPLGKMLPIGDRIIPLAGLAAQLGLAPGPEAQRFAVVVRAEGRDLALSVDDLGAITRVVPEVAPPDVTPGSLVTGIARLADGTPVQVLSPRLLLERTAAREPQAPVASAPESPLEVLLAEDSLATREVLRTILEGAGYRVRVAADGDEALQRIAERAPDVLLTDVEMPGRDGLSLVRAVRATPATARIPVVILTSRGDDPTRLAGQAAGADAYLLKSQLSAGLLYETLIRLGVRRRP